MNQNITFSTVVSEFRKFSSTGTVFDDDPSLMGSWNVNYISDPELKAIGKEMQKVDSGRH